jgi:acyl transferase domain-containing protein
MFNYMNKKEKIAIIGMSALFPGSESLEQFWDNLINKRDLTSIASDKDFGVNPAFFFNENKGVVDRCYSLRGGYIRDFQFNPQGYSLNAGYLAKLDALYQWALHVSKESLAQAKYKDLDKCGVIVGNLSFPTGSTHRILSSVYTDTLTEGLKGVLGAEDFDIASAKLPVPANNPLQGDASQLIKEALSLKGTALDLDAACASSLYAIKLACDELQNHKADMMLAGAVCASDQLFIHMGFSIFHAYARATDKFVPLDKNSAGLVSSEGAAMITLKRLSDAERDGDNILGVIAGIGLSNDGKGKFLLSPNPKGQLLAFERAYQESGTTPDKTTYIECHATGTPLGDITEINSIEEYFSALWQKAAVRFGKVQHGAFIDCCGYDRLV